MVCGTNPLCGVGLFWAKEVERKGKNLVTLKKN